jgi:hypothetical protein
MEHTSIVLCAVLMVKIVYAILAWWWSWSSNQATPRRNEEDEKVGGGTTTTPSSSAAEQQQEHYTGILNRCPWPFIFFHDVKQGLQDSPTWMVVTYIVLKRIYRHYLGSFFRGGGGGT